MRKRIHIFMITYLICSFFLIQQLFINSHHNMDSFIIQDKPISALNFPNDFAQMKNATYTYRQQMNHWKDGTFTSSGNISLFYTFPTSSEVQIQSNYNLNVWQKSCDEPNQLNGTIKTISNVTDRYISSTSIKIGNLDLSGKYHQWYIGSSLVGNFPHLIMIEEMMYLHGMDGINESIQDVPVFNYKGNEYITIMGEPIEAIKITWDGQRLYAGSICGIGLLPYINISSEYYYHPLSGILLEAKTYITEYMKNSSDPFIYQQFEFTRTIRGLNDDGKWDSSTNITSTSNWWLNLRQEEREIIITIVASVGILAIGALAVILIHRQGTKWKAKALLEYEEIQKAQTKDHESK